MSESLLIANGRVIDPAAGSDAVRDLRIRDGVVVEIGRGLPRGPERVFDATGCIVTPGFVDLHAHLREPEFARLE